MLHVYIDNITTSATLSDTLIINNSAKYGESSNKMTVQNVQTPQYLGVQSHTSANKSLTVENQSDCGHLPTPLAMVRPAGCTPITLYCTCIQYKLLCNCQ
jgi:hypothetical protein